YTKDQQADITLHAGIHSLIRSPSTRYLVSGGHLYACSVRPLYFGREREGTLLGYVVSGFAVDRDILGKISQATAADAAFISEGHALASTLELPVLNELAGRSISSSHGPSAPVSLELGRERFIAAVEDLSPS